MTKISPTAIRRGFGERLRLSYLAGCREEPAFGGAIDIFIMSEITSGTWVLRGVLYWNGSRQAFAVYCQFSGHPSPFETE